MHQGLDRDGHCLFGSLDRGRLGEVDRQDDRPARCCNQVEPLVFFVRSTDNRIQTQFARYSVCAQGVELIGSVEEDRSLAAEESLHRLEGIVALGTGKRLVATVSVPGLTVPVGVIKGLTEKRHCPHGRIRVAIFIPDAPCCERAVHGDSVAKYGCVRITITGGHNSAGSLDNSLSRGKQPGRNSLRPIGLVRVFVRRILKFCAHLRRHGRIPVVGAGLDRWCPCRFGGPCSTTTAASASPLSTSREFSVCVDESRIHCLTVKIPDTRIRGRRKIGANCRDDAVADNHRPALDHRRSRIYDTGVDQRMDFRGVVTNSRRRDCSLNRPGNRAGNHSNPDDRIQQ